jgi:cellulose synthase/poly-beta-1,6-N-acetylglucosamine synthase-like glycosyltransferase
LTLFSEIIAISVVLSALIYASAVMILYRGLLRAKRNNPPPVESDDDLPTATVIVPARNEEGNMPEIVKYLKKQDYPPDKSKFSIIDDFSEDNTCRAAIENIGDDPRFTVIQLSKQADYLSSTPLKSKKRAVDYGVKSAQSDVVLFTDADCEFGPGWLRSMAGKLTGDHDIVAGFVGYRNRTFREKIISVESLSNRIIAAGAIGYGKAITCAGGNFGYKRQLYLDVGGLDKYANSFSGDDTLFLQSAVASGAKPLYNFDKNSFVFTCETGGFREIITRRIRRLGITPRFRPGMMIGAGFLFFFFCILSLTPILIMADYKLAIPLSIGWIIKILSDLWILRRGAVVFNCSGSIKYAPAASIIHPFYITAIGFLSLLVKGNWKGRSN